MTASDTSPAPTPPRADVVEQTVHVAGIPVSALVADVPRPRAVIVALHGGGTRSVYFDHPGHPRLSLLRTAAALGFTVLAVDRPGYGSSAGNLQALGTERTRTDVLYAAVDALLADRGRGAGVFLWAHSAGCQPALRMAIEPQGADLLGLELAGMGRDFHPGVHDVFEEWLRDNTRPGPRVNLWHPANAYAPDVKGGLAIGSRSPAYDRLQQQWREEIVDVAAEVRVPVHLSLGEHERVWRNGPEALADLASLFTASPRVLVAEQAGAGHNTSVGHTALAYHLRVLSFVEACALGVRALPSEQGRPL
ncbi:alpha/beta hydrolase [Streptomyces sp. NPDC020792]|uniref:alpha/beta hydrolase n=1 Tax=Streptomyces sp. NPDC020792 TaxID=3365089 RepID=UPI0037B7987F